MKTGKVQWHFQTTHHDLWDYDVPSQPALVDMPDASGKIVPAVVQLTKRGQIFALDRATGKPITDVVENALAATGYAAADIDWFVPHQANKRIIDSSALKLGIAPEKVVSTVALHGNTSAASIPLALAVAQDDGRIKAGDLVMLEAMGGGFTWGAVLLRW